MPIVKHDKIVPEAFKGGASYRTVVGDQDGSTPIRLGIQTSPPGYRTPLHSHPYMETITVMQGTGEAWISGSDDIVTLMPGITLVLPADVQHWFGVTGEQPLVTLGVHASPCRVVTVADTQGSVEPKD